MDSLRTDETWTQIYHRHMDTVYRICFSFMKNPSDTEDMVQETFLKLIASQKQFHSTEHEKAWLIVTASNTCKDALKNLWNKRENLDDIQELPQPQDTSFEIDGVLSAILALPPAYKDVVYLYYYEGYSTPEIAKLLHCPKSTVRNRLARARKQLKLDLGGDFNDQT